MSRLHHQWSYHLASVHLAESHVPDNTVPSKYCPSARQLGRHGQRYTHATERRESWLLRVVSQARHQAVTSIELRYTILCSITCGRSFTRPLAELSIFMGYKLEVMIFFSFLRMGYQEYFIWNFNEHYIHIKPVFGIELFLNLMNKGAITMQHKK